MGYCVVTCTLQVRVSNDISSELYTWQVFAVLLKHDGNKNYHNCTWYYLLQSKADQKWNKFSSYMCLVNGLG
jgi:hypothetical protein